MAANKNLDIGAIDVPNVVVPLTPSYNTSGIDSYTALYTNALEQRKINCLYEIVNNYANNNKTVYLTKRPGVTARSSTWGTATQTAYLVELAPEAGALTDANLWVVNKSGNDIRVSDTSLTTVVDSTAGYYPVYIDKTTIANADTVILQLRNSSGTSKVYYSTTIGTWTAISDSDFTSLVIKGKMEFMDGYAFGLTSKNKIYNSDLNSLSSWAATSFIAKQIQQDTPMGLARLGKLIVAFGMSTMEVFHDAGAPSGSPLENLPDLADKGVGLGSATSTYVRNYYTVNNNLLYFVGGSPTGVYAFNGERVEKVSNSAIDKVLASGSWYNIGTLTFSGRTAIAIALDNVTATTQKALVFFPEYKEWFEWTSDVFQPISGIRTGSVLLGIGASSKGHTLYDISETTDNWQDAGGSFTETVQFKLPNSGNQIKRMRMCGLQGMTATTTDNVSVSFSDDDGQTWTTARTIDMSAMTKMLFNCGAYRERMVRLTHSANTENRLEAFIAKIE